MPGISHAKSSPQDIDAPLTPAERQARAASIARAREQGDAGETVPGEAVFEWLATWGTEDELPVPRPAPRRP